MKKIEIQNHELSYIDVGLGAAVVFVHGTPVSSEEFREVIDKLKNKYRCIAIDHLGFGDSAKPINGDYSLSAHRERLKLFLNKLDVQRFHLVVTDFGGPIALPLAVENWDKVLSLTIMNSWGWLLEETETQLKSTGWLMRSWLMRLMYLYLNFSAKVMIKSAWGTYRPLTKERHEFYMNKFKSPSDRLGAWSFVLALFDKNDLSWHVGKKLSILPQKPTLIIWGLSDKFISQKNLTRWQQMLPHAEVHKIEKAGHFVSEECPEAVGDLLQKFFNKEKI